MKADSLELKRAFIASIKPEPWAMDAARVLCNKTSEIFERMGWPSSSPAHHEATITAAARVIQFFHDNPKEAAQVSQGGPL